MNMPCSIPSAANACMCSAVLYRTASSLRAAIGLLSLDSQQLLIPVQCVFVGGTLTRLCTCISFCDVAVRMHVLPQRVAPVRKPPPPASSFVNKHVECLS